MGYVTFTQGSSTRVGELEGSTVYALDWQDSLLALIRAGATPARSGQQFTVEQVKLEAPIIPGKIVAVGKNYAAHAKETGSQVPDAPLLFSKYPSAVIGTGEAITWRSSITNEVDWEGELAIVIGKRGKDIPEADAYSFIFGYTIANDVSGRDLQNRIDKQWTRAKGLDTFCPLGPAIVPSSAVTNPQHLSVVTRVNDAVMQDGNTDEMVYSIPMLVSYISQMFTLEAGDIILTGTPSGVGVGRTPPVFLKEGDVVSITIEGIGTLTNPCSVLS